MPQDLRLPRAVRDCLPELVMSVHIYDSEPSMRFVLNQRAQDAGGGGVARGDYCGADPSPAAPF